MVKKVGLVLGKFLPPHLGHKYLFDFANSDSDKLFILVETRDDDPIPGNRRVEWVRALVPGAVIIQLHGSMPQDPSEVSNFWSLWKNHILRHLPEKPNVVYSSESYGWELANQLGAEHRPADPNRELYTISGTEIRNNPYENWNWICEPGKLWYLKKVSVVGPESVGKSTLAKKLSEQYQTTYVPEYARTFLESKKEAPSFEDMIKIVEGQIASEEVVSLNANRVLFVDTDPLASIIWSNKLFGKCDPQLIEKCRGRKYDMTLLLKPDVPWVKDDVRYFPEDSAHFYNEFETLLKEENRTYEIIEGCCEKREEDAVKILNPLLKFC